MKFVVAIGALALLTIATLVFADNGRMDAIDEPGLFAFYHPMQDVLNGGTPPALLARVYDSAMYSGVTKTRIVRTTHTVPVKYVTKHRLVKTAAR